MNLWEKIPNKGTLLASFGGIFCAMLILKFILLPLTFENHPPGADWVLYGGMLFIAIYIYVAELIIQRVEKMEDDE